MNKLPYGFLLPIFFLVACTSSALVSTPTSQIPQVAPKDATPTPFLLSSGLLPSETNQNQCIPPIVTSGYYDEEGAPTPIPSGNILPLGWKDVTSVPEEFKDKVAYISLSRPRSGYDELWITVLVPEQTGNELYLVYRTDTQEWRKVTGPQGYGLFLDSQNNVWSYWSSPDRSEFTFYRLDESVNQFIQIVDKANRLNSGEIMTDSLDNGHVISNTIKVGSDGVFWFIFRDANDKTASFESLFSFDPSTQQSTRYSIGEDFDSLEIDQDNRIYLVQGGTKLVKFDPAMGKTESVIVPGDGGDAGSSLLLDHEGRLWVSDRARFDNAVINPHIGNPYILVQSPIFIKYVSYLSSYHWFRPRVILESIDGRIWYDGDVWFDPANGEWCRFTTYPSNIVEDSKNSLWMIADGKLFELTLGK